MSGNVLKCPVMSIERIEQMCYHGNYGGLSPRGCRNKAASFLLFSARKGRTVLLKEDEKKNES